jgi:NDP-sugar pyrophosphorylase family protein
MVIVIPMAGRGTRFINHGIDTPKPFIAVAGRPMVAWAYESVSHLPTSRIVFVVLADHARRYGFDRLARTIAGHRAAIVELDGVTEGQMCTVLAARAYIDTEEDLLVASADTWVDSDLGRDIQNRPDECRGLISVARLPGDQWSFAAVNDAGRVTRVAEKERVSPLASTGLYYFSSGREFVEAADEIITSGMRTRGEYYVIPVYRRYIEMGRFVGVSEARTVWDMGTPDALHHFEEHVNAERNGLVPPETHADD